MRPVLFTIFGFDVQTYGVSKALAAIVAAVLLARAFRRIGLATEQAHNLVLWATLWGFVGAKIYYLGERWPQITVHDLGGMGFTWYGGFGAGALAAVVYSRRHALPLDLVSGASAAPLSVAYAIGRLGCLLSGDGTYGRPTSLPWGMRFPNGAVPVDVSVHPTPAYEALAALAIAAVLVRLTRHLGAIQLFALYLVLSGAARFLVEFLRTNSTVLAGLTQPQLWALAGIAVGAWLFRGGRGGRRLPDPSPAAGSSRLSTADASASQG